MPQFERRLYEPSDDLQPFDGDEDMEDEGSRLPLLIGIALIVLLSFAGVVWLAYTQGVQRGRADAPQIAGTQRDTNLASADQKPTPYSKLKIYQPPKSDEDVASDDPAPPPSAVTAPNIPSAAPPSAGKTQSGTASGKEAEALKSAGTEFAAPAPPPADADAPARTATSSTRAITPPSSTSSAKLAKPTAEPKAAPVVIKTSAKPSPPKPAATAATSKLAEAKPVAAKSPPPKPVTTTPAKQQLQPRYRRRKSARQKSRRLPRLQQRRQRPRLQLQPHLRTPPQRQAVEASSCRSDHTNRIRKRTRRGRHTRARTARWRGIRLTCARWNSAPKARGIASVSDPSRVSQRPMPLAQS